MVLPERFSELPEYAFPRLRSLLDAHAPGGDVIHMSLGEPKHPFPPKVTEIVAASGAGFNVYPPNDGSPELLTSISGWLARRYGVSVGPERLMALNGTREGLYNVALALCPETKRGKRAIVLTPNPFYPVYMMGALTLGAQPVYVAATAQTGFLPDFTALEPEILDRTAVAFICSPSNPQGAIAGRDYWRNLLALAERHDFTVFADECYCELYRGAPPPGALEVAAEVGADPERVVAFHSLSKRSNLPGLRSGFVAGGRGSIAAIRQHRSYAGATLPLPLQRAAEWVWSDDAHVEENRALYRAKFDLADRIFGNVPGYRPPQAGFFLWLAVEDGEAAALKLWKETGVRVLPGAYLAQTVNGQNPAKSYIRVAMVAHYEQVERGLNAIRATIYD